MDYRTGILFTTLPQVLARNGLRSAPLQAARDLCVQIHGRFCPRAFRHQCAAPRWLSTQVLGQSQRENEGRQRPELCVLAVRGAMSWGPLATGTRPLWPLSYRCIEKALDDIPSVILAARQWTVAPVRNLLYLLQNVNPAIVRKTWRKSIIH